jgi:hypothetical protein
MDKRKAAAAAVGAGALVLGGFVVGMLDPLHVASAQQAPSTTEATSPTTPGSSAQMPSTNGTTGSNEDPTHEAGESAQQEADEDAGRAHHGGRGGHGASNEDPTHEAGESAQREAEENAENGNGSGSNGSGSSATPAPSAPPTTG